jgi:hypothetical protein
MCHAGGEPRHIDCRAPDLHREEGATMNKEQTSAQSTSKPERNDSALGRAERAAEQVRGATAERMEHAKSTAESAKANAAERVRKLGNAVRKIGEHMRIEEQMYIADRANDAATRLDGVADYLRDAELGTLLNDAEDLARRKPAWVYGSTFIVGLAAARFLRSGTRHGDGELRPRARGRDLELPAERGVLLTQGEPR